MEKKKRLPTEPKKTNHGLQSDIVHGPDTSRREPISSCGRNEREHVDQRKEKSPGRSSDGEYRPSYCPLNLKALPKIRTGDVIRGWWAFSNPSQPFTGQ